MVLGELVFERSQEMIVAKNVDHLVLVERRGAGPHKARPQITDDGQRNAVLGVYFFESIADSDVLFTFDHHTLKDMPRAAVHEHQRALATLLLGRAIKVEEVSAMGANVLPDVGLAIVVQQPTKIEKPFGHRANRTEGQINLCRRALQVGLDFVKLTVVVITQAADFDHQIERHAISLIDHHGSQIWFVADDLIWRG